MPELDAEPDAEREPDEEAEPVQAPEPDQEPEPVQAPEPDREPEPVLDARGLGLRLRSGWVFRHMDLRAEAGEHLEIVGSGGTGRSMLLLALVGRARHSTGELTVLGTAVPAGWHGAAAARSVRRRTAVAQVGPLVELDEQMTVAQAVADRRHWDQGRRGGLTFDDAAAAVGLEIAAGSRIEHLAAVDRVLLGVAAALTAPHEVLVVDDLDVGLSPDEHRRVGDALAGVAGSGSVVVSVAARPSGSPRARVVAMHPHEPVHAAAKEMAR